jgi:hypothetical protein
MEDLSEGEEMFLTYVSFSNCPLNYETLLEIEEVKGKEKRRYYIAS